MITQWKIQPLNANNILFNTFFPETSCEVVEASLRQGLSTQPSFHHLTLLWITNQLEGLNFLPLLQQSSSKTSFISFLALTREMQPNICAFCELKVREVLSAKLF